MLRLLIVFTIAIISFVASFHLNVEDDINQSQSSTVSLQHFTIFKVLGEGAAGKVFLARKSGGLDNGTLYALKALQIPKYHESLDIYFGCFCRERSILERAREWPWAVGLHYAFIEANWLFYVMDIASGGDVEVRIEADNPDAAARKLILANAVIVVEKLYKAGYLHNDLSFRNFLVDGKGHLMLTDFAITCRTSEWKNDDWKYFYRMCDFLFSKPIEGDQLSLQDMFHNMTDDAQLPELKNHPYFNGIDWEKEMHETDPVFEPAEVQFDEEKTIDIAKELKFDYTIDETIVDRLRNHTYISPEHRN